MHVLDVWLLSKTEKKKKKQVSVLFLISFSLFLTISDGSSN